MGRDPCMNPARRNPSQSGALDCERIPQCDIYHIVVFVESRSFTARLSHLAKSSWPDVLESIQDALLANPRRGDLVRGLGGIRKARASNPSRGKGQRGGFRYLYLYLEHRSHIHLLFFLDKNEQEDLDSGQRAALRAMVEAIREA